MDEPQSEAGSDSASRLQLHGRATRALIANYIHELSERHNGGASHDESPTDDPSKPARGG
jgi:hypothetical protein